MQLGRDAISRTPADPIYRADSIASSRHIASGFSRGIRAEVCDAPESLCRATGRGSPVLVEIIAVGVHVMRQAEAVLAHETLGEIGIPGFERGDDGDVFPDRPLRPVTLPQCRAADA